MDIEFHYYITYLTATRAGFHPDDALIIAQSSEYVDENVRTYEVNKGRSNAFTSQITQAFDELDEIPLDPQGQIGLYSVFHFIPGNPHAPTAVRKDEKIHPLNTTPNSQNAQRIFVTALKSDDPYRIGIATHGYVDTWAHQNFIGMKDEFNGLDGDGIGKWIVPNLGHADVGSSPDCPATIWTDSRLVNDRVNNKSRFSEAAENLFLRFWEYNALSIEEAPLHSFLSDITNAIGPTNAGSKEERIERYKNLALQDAYGKQEIPDFDKEYWFEEALDQKLRHGDTERTANRSASGSYEYFWKNADTCQSTDWYKFQCAAKEHHRETLSYLIENVPAVSEYFQERVS